MTPKRPWVRYWRIAREHLADRLAPGRTEELHARLKEYERGWAPGHFYSPVPDLVEVASRGAQIFDTSSTNLPGVDLNEAGQECCFDELSAFYADQPFTPDAKTNRYGFANPNFQEGEAIILQAFMRSYRPQRIIEVGSG